MKRYVKVLSAIITVILFISASMPSAFAKDFATKLDTNIGVNTQYVYSENNVSWLRELTVKEDLLSVEGIALAETLIPVTDYPYTSDAPHFKKQVDECVKNYTLDEESQRAAYLYVLNQIGALTIISEPTVSNQTKADWLRENGIIVTAEDEADAERVLMISALYAMMRNDLYYVYKGEHLEIPEGSTLEEALVFYIASLSGNQNSLTAFILKHFGKNTFGSLEDYIYYTSLMSLYVNGYVTFKEVPVLERKEVFRRVAIMTIRGYGLSIDSEAATHEELTQKYLTAMLGTQFKVSLDPTSLESAKKVQTIPYYILQRMALEDANVTISHTKYSYEECFDIVIKRTNRFRLENEFYSDVYEYDVYLDAKRNDIYINPEPIKTGTLTSINGQTVQAGRYALVKLADQLKQTITVVSSYTVNGKTTKSTYKINIYQGTKPPQGSNLTGIIPTYGTTVDSNGQTHIVTATPSYPAAAPIVSNFNDAAMNIVGNILSLNENGQLVDQNGNIVGSGTYQPLPEGYKYVVGEDGIIKVVFMGSTTTLLSTTTPSESDKTDKQLKKGIIIALLILCLLFLIVLAVIMAKSKGKTKSQKTLERRNKEKAKKAKREARASKKKK